MLFYECPEATKSRLKGLGFVYFWLYYYIYIYIDRLEERYHQTSRLSQKKALCSFAFGFTFITIYILSYYILTNFKVNHQKNKTK